MSEKTEQPTAKRLRKAREEGNVPVSAGVLQAVGFVVALALIPAAAGALAQEFVAALRRALATSSSPPVIQGAVSLWIPVLRITAPALVVVFATVALVGGIQTKGLLAVSRLKPDLSRFSLASLARVLFSKQRAFAVFRALVAFCVVTWLVVSKFQNHMLDLARSTGRIDATLTVGSSIAIEIAKAVAAVLVILAAADWAVSYRGWLDRLKMSKDEVKRETKESEGDPEIKAQRERLHQELLSSAAAQAVHQATVVVVNPVHLANALRYDEDQDDAPVLLVKGEGPVARRIVEEAQAVNVPVKQDVPLARALFELPEGEQIPPELYEAVAVVLQEVFETEDQQRQHGTSSGDSSSQRKT